MPSGQNVPRRVIADAHAESNSVQIKLKLSADRFKPWRHPVVVAMSPDDAMALSIDLQKAAIAARLAET